MWSQGKGDIFSLDSTFTLHNLQISSPESKQKNSTTLELRHFIKCFLAIKCHPPRLPSLTLQRSVGQSDS